MREITNSAIRTANRNAVGGGRKRCRKGKNCSATCITPGDVCLVGLSEGISKSLSQASTEIKRLVDFYNLNKGKVEAYGLRGVFDDAADRVKFNKGKKAALESEVKPIKKPPVQKPPVQKPKVEDELKVKGVRPASKVTPQNSIAPKEVSDLINQVQGRRPDANTVNYNWTETAIAGVLSGYKINSKEDLVAAIKNMQIENGDKYISNLLFGSKGNNPSSEKQFTTYIQNSQKLWAPWLATNSVDKVSVPGSTRQSPSIQEIDKGLNKRQIKSDVVVWIKGSPVGISVKSGPGDPLTNFAIEGGRNSSLKEIRLQMLKDAGFSKDWAKGKTAAEKSEIRQEINKLFYDKKSPYWEGVKSYVKANEKFILKDLIDGMTARGVSYPIYETDGKNLKTLDSVYEKLTNPKSKVELRVVESTAKNPRGSALLPVGIFVDGKQEYGGSIRWKGNVFTPPNLMITNIQSD